MKKEKPVLTQFRAIKAENKDCVLMFRLGGFFVMFLEDAFIASKVLGLKVIARNLGLGKMVPACGVPASAAETRARNLAEQGFSVAICDQVEGESETPGVKNRAVTQIMHPSENIAKAAHIVEEEYAAFLADFDARLVEQEKDKQTHQNVNNTSKTDFKIVSELNSLDLEQFSPTAAWALLYYWKRIYCGEK